MRRGELQTCGSVTGAVTGFPRCSEQLALSEPLADRVRSVRSDRLSDLSPDSVSVLLPVVEADSMRVRDLDSSSDPVSDRLPVSVSCDVTLWDPDAEWLFVLDLVLLAEQLSELRSLALPDLLAVLEIDGEVDSCFELVTLLACDPVVEAELVPAVLLVPFPVSV